MATALNVASKDRFRAIAGIKNPHGFTLLELLLVLAMVGLLVTVAVWGGRGLSRGWLVKRAGHQLLEDLKSVQAKAELSGSLTISGGLPVIQQNFLVFAPDSRQYAAYTWRDGDGNGAVGSGETLLLWQKNLPPGVSFGWMPGIDRRACSNVAGAPGSAVSFSSPAYMPCADQPCIRFDRHGFSVLGPGAIYLTEGEHSLAITATRPGHFTLCEWDGERWH